MKLFRNILIGLNLVGSDSGGRQIGEFCPWLDLALEGSGTKGVTLSIYFQEAVRLQGECRVVEPAKIP